MYGTDCCTKDRLYRVRSEQSALLDKRQSFNNKNFAAKV